MYALLSRLWISEPDSELIESLSEGDVSSALPEWFEIPEGDTLADLRADFTQLFIGPKDQLPPYQSVWQHGQFEGASTGTMRTYFEVLGYLPETVAVDGVMPDHLAVQFDAMRFVLESASTPEPAHALVDLVASFFDDSLTWAMPLINAVGNRATTGFYRSIARLTAEFLRDEAERFGHTA